MKPICVVAVACLVTALIMDIICKKYSAGVALEKARCVQEQADGRVPLPERQAVTGIGSLISFGSYALFCMGVVAWFVAATRKEKCPVVVLVVLVSAFLLLQLVFV